MVVNLIEDFDGEAIVDTSNPNVLHIIYPNGKKLTKEQLDPNIGGFIPRGK